MSAPWVVGNSGVSALRIERGRRGIGHDVQGNHLLTGQQVRGDQLGAQAARDQSREAGAYRAGLRRCGGARRAGQLHDARIDVHAGRLVKVAGGRVVHQLRLR